MLIVKGRDIDALTIVPQIREELRIEENHGYARLGEEELPMRLLIGFAMLGMSLAVMAPWMSCATYPQDSLRYGALWRLFAYKDGSGLGDLPFWIIHGTADRAVPVKQSKVVVDKRGKGWQRIPVDIRLREGANHGTLPACFIWKKPISGSSPHSLSR